MQNKIMFIALYSAAFIGRVDTAAALPNMWDRAKLDFSEKISIQSHCS
jgi:hypothetical protein